MTVASTPGFSSLTGLVKAFDHSRVGGSPCKFYAPPVQRIAWLNTRNRAIEGGREFQLSPKPEKLAAQLLLAQANRNQYSQIQQIGRRMGIVDAAKLEIWGARTLAAATINGLATPSEVVQAFRLGEASQLLRRETLAPEQVTQLRQLASDVKPKDPRAAERAKQAEQMRQQQINQAANTQQSQPVQQQQQGPGTLSFGAGPLVQPWSEDKIRAAVNKLAQDYNFKGARQIRLIEDMLVNPNLSISDRAEMLGVSRSSVADASLQIQIGRAHV